MTEATRKPREDSGTETTARDRPPARSGGRRRLLERDGFWIVVMLAPLFGGLAVFYYGPIALTFYYTFTDWGSFGVYEWTGLDNFERALGDTTLHKAVRNTLLFTFLSVPISVALSVVVAVLLNQKLRGRIIYRTLYFLPVVTMPAAVALIWRYVYNPGYGLANHMLSVVGIDGPRWLSPQLALFALVVVQVWLTVGYNMIILLSGLQGIPRVQYEAAIIDGAGPLARFWKITVPLLTPTIFFTTIISLINAFQVFDLILLMIGSDSTAIETTQSLVYLFYQQAFVLNQRGYGAVIVLVLFVIILATTLVNLWGQRRWVHYE